MNKTIPILLWLMVLVFGGFTYFYLQNKDPDSLGTFSPGNEKEPGVAYQQVPWKHFQNVPRFKLINQDGEEFDSSELAGRPYVVSFFFAECPNICRDLNKQIQRLRERVSDPELVFVSLTVDPANDTPEVLKRYSADFDADPTNWMFLTGELNKIEEVGERSFQVIVDKATHTDNILLVDRWGRFRDRFKWNSPYDMKRFVNVSKDVLAEKEPPLDQTFESRNMMAGTMPADIKSIKWIREFHLTDQDERSFYSRDLTGEVWIANFFFSTCPDVCVRQNEYIAGLQKRLTDHPAKIVSITTDPGTDTPGVLRDYAQKVGADLDSWNFLTGNSTYIKRIGSEFFRTATSEGHHSSRLFVVDRWGQVRGSYDWQESGDEVKMLQLIDELNQETEPKVVNEQK